MVRAAQGVDLHLLVFHQCCQLRFFQVRPVSMKAGQHAARPTAGAGDPALLDLGRPAEIAPELDRCSLPSFASLSMVRHMEADLFLIALIPLASNYLGTAAIGEMRDETSDKTGAEFHSKRLCAGGCYSW